MRFLAFKPVQGYPSATCPVSRVKQAEPSPACSFQTPKRVINAMGIALYGVDAVCMAVLAVSADKWEGTSRAEKVDSAVVIVQVVTLAGK